MPILYQFLLCTLPEESHLSNDPDYLCSIKQERNGGPNRFIALTCSDYLGIGNPGHELPHPSFSHPFFFMDDNFSPE